MPRWFWNGQVTVIKLALMAVLFFAYANDPMGF